MKLNKTKVRYFLRQKRKGVATKEIARDVKVSKRGVQKIIREYMETGLEPILGEKIGRPCKSYNEKEADIIRAAHARYRFGARMLDHGSEFGSHNFTGPYIPERALRRKCLWKLFAIGHRLFEL